MEKFIDNKNDKKYILYCHRNMINNKLYFGITNTSLDVRARKNGRGYYSQVFGRAIKKYGWDNFQHIIIAENLSKEIACESEKYLIAKYNTTNPQYGYNITNGGEGNDSPRSLESNIKRSLSESGEKHWHYGQKWSPEVIEKLHKPHPSIKGDNNPSKRPEVRKKISDKNKEWHTLHPDFSTTLGFKHSNETKQKISNANSGENNGNYGKHWYNNGEQSILTYDCPEGYSLGRVKKNG